MRECSACHALLPMSAFHSKSGRCKSCKASLDKGRVRSDSREPARNDTDAARERKRRWRQAHGRDRIKEAARNAVRRAIERGELRVPAGCIQCGASPRRRDGARALQAHHTDYTKPLCVEWMCTPCHASAHAARQAEPQEGHGESNAPPVVGS